MTTNIIEQYPIKKCLVSLIETQPRKGRTEKTLDIAFSSKDIIKNALDGPLDIAI